LDVRVESSTHLMSSRQRRLVVEADGGAEELQTSAEMIAAQAARPAARKAG
jgi:hypothetical protein